MPVVPARPAGASIDLGPGTVISSFLTLSFVFLVAIVNLALGFAAALLMGRGPQQGFELQSKLSFWFFSLGFVRLARIIHENRGRLERSANS